MSAVLWSLAAVSAAAQGVLLTIVLFFKRENRLPNRLLGMLLLLLALNLLEWALWWSGQIRQFPAMRAVSFGLPLLYGPLLFLFFEATFKRRPLKIKDLVHFLPFGAAVFFMLPFYLRFFKDLAAALRWIPPPMRWPWFPVLIFAQMIAYGIWIKRRFKQHFADHRELKRWRRRLLVAYWGIVGTCLFYRLLPVFGLSHPGWVYLVAASLSFFIYLVAWLGYIEPRVFAGLPLEEALHPLKYRKSVLSAADSAALFQRITAWMETEKPFRDPAFSLDRLAAKLESQRHHISQAINEQSGKSFSAFVSGYRVREAERLLAATKKQEKNAIEVAYEVGFGTKNAFNLAFKKQTGLTPTAYRRAREKKA